MLSPHPPRHDDSGAGQRLDSGRILGWVLAGLVVLAFGATVALQLEKRPELSPVGRGEKLAHDAGCFSCHGRGDGETRFNRRKTDEGWVAKENPTFWDNEIKKSAEVIEWITHGVTPTWAERHKQLFLQMPAYKDRLDPEEIDAIAAWILAEGLRITQADALRKPAPPVPSPLPADPNALFALGDRLSRANGCYQCHGELGQGGVANPDSFKGYIPGFFGRDLLALTNNGDRTEILHWIDHGRGRAIESGLLGRLATRYLDRQTIPMPGYRDQLSAAEKDALTEFILLLNRKGPLPAREVELISSALDPEES